MSVGFNLPLSSISAFSADLKEIKLHTDYSGISEQTKPLQPIGQAADFKFESKFKPGQVICQSLPKAILEDKVLTSKSIAELLGQLSCSAWAGQMGKHKHRVYPSRQNLLLAVTS